MREYYYNGIRLFDVEHLKDTFLGHDLRGSYLIGGELKRGVFYKKQLTYKDIAKPRKKKKYKPKTPKSLTEAQQEWVQDEIIAKQLSWLKDERPVDKVT